MSDLNKSIVIDQSSDSNDLNDLNNSGDVNDSKLDSKPFFDYRIGDEACDYDSDSEYEREIRDSVNTMSQHKISDLIKILTYHMSKHGDIPLIYRGRDCACNFESFYDFCHIAKVEQTDNKVLMLGDFHADGCSHLCSMLRLKYIKKD